MQHIGGVGDFHRIVTIRQTGEFILTGGIGNSAANQAVAAVKQRYRDARNGQIRARYVHAAITITVEKYRVADSVAARSQVIAKIRIDEHIAGAEDDWGAGFVVQ